MLKQVCLFFRPGLIVGNIFFFPVYQAGLNTKIKGAMRGKFIHAGLGKDKTRMNQHSCPQKW